MLRLPGMSWHLHSTHRQNRSTWTMSIILYVHVCCSVMKVRWMCLDTADANLLNMPEKACQIILAAYCVILQFFKPFSYWALPSLFQWQCNPKVTQNEQLCFSQPLKSTAAKNQRLSFLAVWKQKTLISQPLKLLLLTLWCHFHEWTLSDIGQEV